MSQSNKSIFLNVSDIPSFIGENPWDYTLAFERLWNKCENVNLKTDEIKIEECLGQETLKVIKSETIPMEQKKKILKESISKIETCWMGDGDNGSQVQEFVSSEIIKKAESLINKTYGTLKEYSAIEMFEKKYKTKLDTNQKYYKTLLTTFKDINWYIGGKMDGIQKEDSYIVEVKNRTKNFFVKIRDYEMTQIQIYLHLIGFENAKLVEKYKCNIRVTDISKDTLWINRTLENLKIFIENFCNFLDNEDLKKEYLNLSFEMKKVFLQNLYIHKMNL